MRAYLMTSGAIFGLVALVHVWRAFEEGIQLATQPWYVLLTLAAAALCIWAWKLLRDLRRTG